MTPSSKQPNPTRLARLNVAGAERLPWFPVFPSDLDGDPDFRLASLAERGALFALWCIQWSSPDDSVPSDPGAVARLLGITRDDALAVLPFVLKYFAIHGDRMGDPRLSALRQNAADLSRKRREAANGRWSKERGV